MQIDRVTFVITGGATGIGLATAQLATKQGANVVLMDIDATALRRARSELPEDRTATVVADVRSPAEHGRTVANAVETFGGFDVWVNNAGLARHRLIVDYTEEQLDSMMDVNLKGTVLGSQAALRHLGPKRSGHILNIVSTAGLRGIPTESFYCATKWAVRGFTQALVEEAARHRVRVTAILPGGVDTAFWDEARESDVNCDHMLRPEHVADAILAAVKMDDACVVRELQVRSVTDADFGAS